MFQKRIYLDYASLTPIDPRVLRTMRRYSTSKYANPSSLYAEGVNAKKIIAASRSTVASFIHAHADEIVFTSGGTEANALALDGVVRAARAKGIARPHIIISAIEHSSIIETAGMLEGYGCDVTRLVVDSSGLVSLTELKAAINARTVLVSIMMVNNEIGTKQPIRDIAKLVRDSRTNMSYPLFHTDAAQATLEEALYVDKLGVDLLTLDASKMYGPRSIGCLYVRRGTPITPLIYGGGQESGMRSGTENLPAIAGFACAVELIEEEYKKEAFKKIDALRMYFVRELAMLRPNIRINSSLTQSVSHIVNVSIPGIDNEFFLFQLDARGIACSTKSSCLRDADESYVLRSIGADSATSLRFSFGRWTTQRDVKRALRAISTLLSTKQKTHLLRCKNGENKKVRHGESSDDEDLHDARIAGTHL